MATLSRSVTMVMRHVSRLVGQVHQSTRFFNRSARTWSNGNLQLRGPVVSGASRLLQNRGPNNLHPAARAASRAAPTASMKADKPLTAQGEINAFEVNGTGNILTVTWEDGQLSNFHSLWLRYNCHCQDCLEEHSGQRLYECENLDPDVTIESAVREGDSLVIQFGGKEKHEGRVPVQFLKHYDYSNTALERKKAAVEIDTFATEIPELSYQDLIQKEDGLYRWTKSLSDYGFCVIKGVPTEEDMLLKVVEMIGPAQETVYDKTFLVRVSEEQMTDVSFSSRSIVYHQDLAYYESPPGLQFLHAIKFDDCVTGGESLIVDVFKVTNEFRKSHPAEFEALCTIPATFQKIHYGRVFPVHITFTKPVIVLNFDKQIVGVNWEPLHEGPIEVPEHQVEAFYKAHIAFAKAMKEAPVQFEWRMEEGDLLSFNNRRVCHSRNTFVLNGGTRYLKGCYMNSDLFKSQVNVQSNKFGNGQPCKRIGTQCLF